MAVLSAIKRMTVDEFLALPPCDEWHELVDGEIVMTPRPGSDHQKLVGYLYHLLFERVGMQGQLLVEKEMIVKVQEDKQRVRCPDVLYVREARKRIVTDRAVEGPADILIEILSKTTEEVDRITKRDEYRACGVPEYWIVDLDDRAVLVHSFHTDTHQVHQRSSSFDSPVLTELGFSSTFKVDQIFQVLE